MLQMSEQSSKRTWMIFSYIAIITLFVAVGAIAGLMVFITMHFKVGLRSDQGY